MKAQRGTLLVKITAQGDTSKWRAKDQMKFAKAILGFLKALDIDLHGKQRVNWVITEMTKDD